jgi:outer membrane protein TolC
MLQWGVTAGASVVQPIFMGGRIINGNKLAKVGVEASEKQVEVSERDILQEVEDTYWMVAGLYEKRETIKQVRELLDTIQGVADLAFNNGLVTGNDVLKVQLKKNEIETKATQLEDGIVLASKLLCQLTGLDYTGELELEPFPKEEAVEAMVLVDTFMVAGRPEAELLELNIKAEQLRKKMTIGEALPQVGIGLQGGYSNFFDRDRWNGLAFAFVRIPITQWWETGHKIKEHNLRIEKAQMMQQDLMGKMALQNEQVYNQLNEAIRLVIQHESGLKMAEDNYRISLMNYEAGMTTMSELLESQALLLQAQNAYTDARISMRAAQRKFNELNK